MGRLTLKAETLVQTMVASLIVLLVFTISLETLSRINTSRNNVELLLDVDYQLSHYVDRFVAGEYELDYYKFEKEWGEIEVRSNPYKGYNNLREVSFKVRVIPVNRVILRKMIVKDES